MCAHTLNVGVSCWLESWRQNLTTDYLGPLSLPVVVNLLYPFASLRFIQCTWGTEWAIMILNEILKSLDFASNSPSIDLWYLLDSCCFHLQAKVCAKL